MVSPNPAAKGAHVPLVSSFMLSTKEGKKAWVEPVIDPAAPDQYRFEVRSGAPSEAAEEKAKSGTKSGGANFSCVLTGTPIANAHAKAEGKAKRMGTRLMAIIAEGERGRVYLPPSEEHEKIAQSAVPEWTPEGQLFDGALGFRIPAYGLIEWRDLFTQRQLVALTTFSDLVAEAREKVLDDARVAGRTDGPRLADGGTGAEGYADAIATYLGFLIDQLANHSANVCGWNATNAQMRSVFARQALPMVWDFAECNLFAETSGSFGSLFERMTKGFDNLGCGRSGQIRQLDARSLIDNAEFVFATDPPYYDNIGYADLSDFFYVWARRTLKDIWPNLFGTVLVPKDDELVATPARHGGRSAAESFFLSGMQRSMATIGKSAPAATVQTIFYAFKQSEAGDDGTESTGWATFLQGLHDASLAVDGTWPIRTEKVGRVRDVEANALASSIVLVCRKRPASATVTTRAEFLKALKRELPAALKLLQAGNIAPVDFAQASIGPGMAIFTRHSKVLEADDSTMTVKTALALINAELDDYLGGQDAEYDAETRFAITWFETHGMQQAAYGDAETLAKARNVSVSGIRDAGLVSAGGGKVKLTPRTEMPADWDPRTDTRVTVWECTQQIIRRLEMDGEDAAADLLARLNGRAEPARDLAYRLYGICERKKWADEARAYNGLVVAWPELVKLASKVNSAPQEPAQAALI